VHFTYLECSAPEWGKKYSLIDLTMEAARAKVLGNIERFAQIRPMLLEHRIDIETELRKKGRGMVPPPHLVLDKLFKM
jgi:hypothetical protein